MAVAVVHSFESVHSHDDKGRTLSRFLPFSRNDFELGCEPRPIWQVVIVIEEEYGFRGYMLPRLQSRYSALVAGLITGVAWAIWHYPPSLIGTGSPLDTPFLLFGIWVVALTVLMTSVFNASRGSVGLMMLFHLAANASFVLLPLLPENRGGDLTAFSVFVALVVVVAAIVVRINGPSSLSTTARTTQR